MRRLRSILVLVATAAAVLAASGGSARAGYAGADGAITYAQNGTIYALEGGRRTVLVAPDHASRVFDPVWSPDGHHLAFVYERFADHEGGEPSYKLQVLDTRSGQSTNVLTGYEDAAPTWSPDGSKLAYLCRDGVTICVVDLDGKLEWTAPAAVPIVQQLAWSPDGRFGYIGEAQQVGAPFRVWVENADGTNAHPVTPDETSAETFGWSTDGSQIAYSDERGHLDVVDSDGENWHVLEDVNSTGVFNPSWSPNGKMIVYVSDVDAQHDRGLVTIDVDGSNRHALTDPTTGGTIDGTTPDWQRLPLLPALVNGPTVSGTPRVGQTLTAAAGTWNGDEPLQYTFRWQRCAPACADLAASSATYTVSRADAGTQLRVVVSASNVAGSATATSAETARVPEPSFTAVHGKRAGTSVRLSFTVCDQSPAAVVVDATDWNLVSGHRRSVQRHAWHVGAGPGCHTARETWKSPHVGSHVIVVAARDGDGVVTKSLRLTLR